MAHATLDTRTRALLEAAILAPSSHNTQPWCFRVDGDAISLFADRTRALPVNDTDDRELTISCGCALFNLRVAAAASGLDTEVQLQPDRLDADLLARVRAVPGTRDAHLGTLLPFVARRRTCRQRFDARPVPGKLLDHLATACAQEGRRCGRSRSKGSGSNWRCWWPKATVRSGAIPAGGASSRPGCIRAAVATDWQCRPWPRALRSSWCAASTWATASRPRTGSSRTARRCSRCW
ncbi:nitroreductase family protein [Ramlibacter montanisoli]|uniref:Nitroreductase domain-containing protein n=1 Tax=Ramlibacter montanisoli TaxID=2732512 RepID=A0A849K9L3_9BURK|nr:hypothetical protein [Ramlibacter montanisoli]